MRRVTWLAAVDIDDHIAVQQLQRLFLRGSHHEDAFLRAEVFSEFRREIHQFHVTPVPRMTHAEFECMRTALAQMVQHLQIFKPFECVQSFQIEVPVAGHVEYHMERVDVLSHNRR